MTYETILYEVSDQVATVTLNRPTARNALDGRMREELAHAIATLRRDDGVKAVVLTGAGGAFCAGGDLRSAPPKGAEEARRAISDLHVWFAELVNLEKPVIAAVDGPAFGAGFNLALAADFIIASTRARFSQAFCRVGLVPDLGGMFLLPRIMGLMRAKELIFSGRVVEPQEAKALGFVYSIHEPDVLMDEAIELAMRFKGAPTLAIGLAKNVLNQSHNLDQHALAELESSAQAICVVSDYYRIATEKFLRKEPSAFDWERFEKNKRAAVKK